MSDKESPYEMEIMAFLILFVLGGFLVIIWFIFREQLTEVYRWIRVFEMWVASTIVGDNFTTIVPGFGSQELGMWRDWLPNADVKNIGNQEIKATTYVAMNALRPWLGLALLVMATIVMIAEPGAKFRRKMDLQGLMEEQAQSFPAIAPFLKFNPLKANARVVGQAVPAKLPLFAEALSPEEWVTYNQVPFVNGKLNRQKAYRGFLRQLGGRWQGPAKLPMHAQGLYAVFALKHVRKRDESEALLNELSLSWSARGGFKPSSKLVSRIRQIIKDPAVGGKLRPYADMHAFNTTAMLRCLARAREEGGVLAPATFLWLRGKDRKLWYPLNNLGRRSYHAEATGALTHYTYELIAGQKIPTPQLEDSIKGLEEFLKGPDAKDIPPLQGTRGSVKRRASKR